MKVTATSYVNIKSVKSFTLPVQVEFDLVEKTTTSYPSPNIGVIQEDNIFVVISNRANQSTRLVSEGDVRQLISDYAVSQNGDHEIIQYDGEQAKGELIRNGESISSATLNYVNSSVNWNFCYGIGASRSSTIKNLKIKPYSEV